MFIKSEVLGIGSLIFGSRPVGVMAVQCHAEAGQILSLLGEGGITNLRGGREATELKHPLMFTNAYSRVN